MKKAFIKGDIITNEYKWVYDFYEFESTCPKDISDVIESLEDGEELQVEVNSPGGIVTAGQEIYTALLSCPNSTAIITGQACSAASVAIMGADKVLMSPVALIMIHNSSIGGVSGDKRDLKRAVGDLTETDKAIASAYAHKTGYEIKDLLKLMDEETWLTANDAIKYGFADGFYQGQQARAAVASAGSLRVTAGMLEQAKEAIKAEKEKAEIKKKLTDDLFMYGI